MNPNNDSLPFPTSPGAVSPVARLELSRERLRQAMQQQHAGRRGGARASASSAQAGGGDGRLRKALESIPGASLVLDALEGWWLQHPLRAVTMVGGEAAKALVQPAAQRNPLTLVAGALVVGAAVVWIKPWRWRLLRPALFAGLATQFASKALAQVPVASWLAMLSRLAPQPQADAGPDAENSPAEAARPSAP